jgi:hypothetical protein
VLVVAVLALSVVRVIVRHVLVALLHVVESALVAVIVVQVVVGAVVLMTVQEVALEVVLEAVRVAVAVVLMTVQEAALVVVLAVVQELAPDHALEHVLTIAKVLAQDIAKVVAQLDAHRVMGVSLVVVVTVHAKSAVTLPVMQVPMHKS